MSGCKQRCCNSPLGTLINGAFKPLNFATGGVIPTPCPGPNQPSNKPGGGAAGGGVGGPPGPQQAAEAIKQDQAQAKARAEAVRYLATVPCHYYPEAEVALITALRTDRSDCVRVGSRARTGSRLLLHQTDRRSAEDRRVRVTERRQSR